MANATMANRQKTINPSTPTQTKDFPENKANKLFNKFYKSDTLKLNFPFSRGIYPLMCRPNHFE